MANNIDLELLQSAIKKVIDEEIKECIENAIIDIQREIEIEIRKRTGSILSRVLNFFHYEQDSKRIIITVDFKNSGLKTELAGER